MTAYVIADYCVPQDLYLCVRDHVLSLVLRLNYILC